MYPCGFFIKYSGNKFSKVLFIYTLKFSRSKSFALCLHIMRPVWVSSMELKEQVISKYKDNLLLITFKQIWFWFCPGFVLVKCKCSKFDFQITCYLSNIVYCCSLLPWCIVLLCTSFLRLQVLQVAIVIPTSWDLLWGEPLTLVQARNKTNFLSSVISFSQDPILENLMGVVILLLSAGFFISNSVAKGSAWKLAKN